LLLDPYLDFVDATIGKDNDLNLVIRAPKASVSNDWLLDTKRKALQKAPAILTFILR
jgi:hypothetical protein